ncbi:cytochrome bd-I ubiquinol oxidase subunit 2 apoprotein [Thermolongibacillus altinsuensis]|jgi:cytochrome d ubiquinol oxidase subunit II|uniref:Cytochrome bd-I ubiquinol oxidase subunit 2 apoprotein n=1 Tax=Thermolongibacillus altinsuensis TaxID=575256 RepID=A0A4R1QAY7_9BACL|nr:cytochrome d ubiquinol oxidase subunit II [Thermolongibacillus altinsuensis]TCL46523.1 cytochrome bd-I ubiquinol oxidase subunit 2 apoprotein [Thermolongibacillus altinsuensis]GMB09896.1 cytochrome c oxidase assembly protein [Thermolongibacillus altinsuensis]
MSHETLAIIWFGLWGLIWTVYFILDGYTLGTGMLFPFITKNRQERNQLQEAVGPFWGGNEVWLITAGGATFAAFPTTYANMFSYLYTPMMLILFALFFRAAGLEFMHKEESPRWQNSWKWSFFGSSVALSFLFGVTFANLYYGLKIGPSGYEGTLLSLLHPYGILGGLLFISLFIVSGSLWIMIKTTGDVADRAYRIARPASVVAAGILAIFFVATSNRTPLFTNFTKLPVLWIIPALAFVASLLTLLFVWQKRIGLAFTNICLTIFSMMATGFIGMFPNMLPSRIADKYSTTLFEAAGSELNLKIMLGVAIVMVPIVIGYQLWSYKLFKEKISKETAKGYQ